MQEFTNLSMYEIKHICLTELSEKPVYKDHRRDHTKPAFIVYRNHNVLQVKISWHNPYLLPREITLSNENIDYRYWFQHKYCICTAKRAVFFIILEVFIHRWPLRTGFTVPAGLTSSSFFLFQGRWHLQGYLKNTKGNT